MADDQATALKTPDSAVSPRDQTTPKQDSYFLDTQGTDLATSNDEVEIPARTEKGARIFDTQPGDKLPELETKAKADGPENDSDASATTPGDTAPSPGSASEPPSRKMSVSSVTFRQPSNPSLPQGTKKKPFDATRRRAASPAHRRCVEDVFAFQTKHSICYPPTTSPRHLAPPCVLPAQTKVTSRLCLFCDEPQARLAASEHGRVG